MFHSRPSEERVKNSIPNNAFVNTLKTKSKQRSRAGNNQRIVVTNSSLMNNRKQFLKIEPNPSQHDTHAAETAYLGPKHSNADGETNLLNGSEAREISYIDPESPLG